MNISQNSSETTLSHSPLPAAEAEPIEPLHLGRLLGQRRAFSAVGGRCSAAHAELLRRIRSEKLYRPVAESWREFCRGHLSISRRHADRLIALLERFGSAYFELAQFVGITPEQYAVIEPLIREGRLQSNGESISLVPENSAELEAAVHNILADAAPDAPRPALSRIDRLARIVARGRTLVSQLRSLYNEASSDADRDLVLNALIYLSNALRDLDPSLPSSPRGGLTRACATVE